MGLSILAAPVITTSPTAAMVFLGDTATFSVAATGSGTLGYQWLRDGAPVSGATNNVLSFPTAVDDDGAFFSVAVADDDGATTSAGAELTIDFGMPGAAHTNQVLAVTDTWRYEVSGADLGTAWRDAGYDDGAWASGGGLLYVETSDLPAAKTTALPLSGGSLPTTCYFRRTFTNDFTNAYSVELVASTVVDDGVVAYLNGAEVLRDGMGEGAIAYDTYASVTVGDATYKGPFSLDAARLESGANLVAVEVHQRSASSSDIVMGMTLDAIWTERVPDTDDPVVQTLDPAAGSSVSSLRQVVVTFSEGVQGVDAADLLINGVAATGVTELSTASYLFAFDEPEEGVVSVAWAAGHGIVDRSAGAHEFSGTDFSYLFSPPSP